VARIRSIERFLDSAFVLPFLRVLAGFDGVLGIVPVLGNLVTTAIALVLVIEAVRLGTRKRTLAKMLLYVGVDFAMGEVPIAGDIADFFFRANRRNLALLREEFPADFPATVAGQAVGQDVGQSTGEDAHGVAPQAPNRDASAPSGRSWAGSRSAPRPDGAAPNAAPASAAAGAPARKFVPNIARQEGLNRRSTFR
jgi:hypothetical protein